MLFHVGLNETHRLCWDCLWESEIFFPLFSLTPSLFAHLLAGMVWPHPPVHKSVVHAACCWSEVSTPVSVYRVLSCPKWKKHTEVSISSSYKQCVNWLCSCSHSQCADEMAVFLIKLPLKYVARTKSDTGMANLPPLQVIFHFLI